MLLLQMLEVECLDVGVGLTHRVGKWQGIANLHCISSGGGHGAKVLIFPESRSSWSKWRSLYLAELLSRVLLLQPHGLKHASFLSFTIS